MSRNRTISLDEDTAKIAERMPNFSRFVRQCLLQHAAHGENTVGSAHLRRHIAPIEARIWGETKDKCNPSHRKGRCVACWGSE